MAVKRLAVNPIPTSSNAARAECEDSDRGDRNRQPAADRATLQDTARGEYEKTNAREVEPMLRNGCVKRDDIGDGKKSSDKPDDAEGPERLRPAFAQSADE